MPSSTFVLPYNPAFSSNGLPLPGAKLYFYLAGTLTPAAIYQDVGLTTPHTNPVVANSAGRYADIYFDDAIPLRVILTDADGVTLDESDPYLYGGADFTAADILTKILTVDGSGSGLDADKLRGTTPTAFGLSLIDDAAASNARTTLGLGSIATQAASAVAITGGTIDGITDLAVADGGTGASTAASARTNLGLGTMATQAASAVAITGGTVTGITDLAVADGGTGASSATTARANLDVDKKFAVNSTSEASRELALTDADTMISQTGTARTYTIPNNTSVAFPIGSRIWFAVTNSSGSITLARDTGVNLLFGGANADRTFAYGGAGTLVKTSTNGWIVFGSGIS